MSTRTPRSKWMVVDDNPFLRTMIGRMLTQAGQAEIESYSSPIDALRAFKEDPEAFSLVVSDLEMPGMNGIEFCHALRLIAPSIRIILATASGAISEADARAQGFDFLLRKPFAYASLCQALPPIGPSSPTPPGK